MAYNGVVDLTCNEEDEFDTLENVLARQDPYQKYSDFREHDESELRRLHVAIQDLHERRTKNIEAVAQVHARVFSDLFIDDSADIARLKRQRTIIDAELDNMHDELDRRRKLAVLHRGIDAEPEDDKKDPAPFEQPPNQQEWESDEIEQEDPQSPTSSDSDSDDEYIRHFPKEVEDKFRSAAMLHFRDDVLWAVETLKNFDATCDITKAPTQKKMINAFKMFDRKRKRTAGTNASARHSKKKSRGVAFGPAVR